MHQKYQNKIFLARCTVSSIESGTVGSAPFVPCATAVTSKWLDEKKYNNKTVDNLLMSINANKEKEKKRKRTAGTDLKNIFYLFEIIFLADSL